MLGTALADLSWRQRGADIEVTMPAPGTVQLPFDGAVVLAIEGVAVQQDVEH